MARPRRSIASFRGQLVMLLASALCIVGLLAGCGTGGATSGTSTGTDTGVSGATSADRSSTSTSVANDAAASSGTARVSVQSVAAKEGPVQNPPEASLGIPPVGFHELKIISPTVLELTLVTSGRQWSTGAGLDFKIPFNLGWYPVEKLPPSSKFAVTVGAQPCVISKVGFKLRPIYMTYAASSSDCDLRVGSYLYLQLARPLADGATVTVSNPDQTLWDDRTTRWQATADPARFSPAIHVNQEGYVPAFSKRATVGYFLGTLDEMALSAQPFQVVDAVSGTTVFSGTLVSHPDKDPIPPACRRNQVYVADFSTLKTPGQYRVRIAGLGQSYPFRIDDGVAADFARTTALGLYHWRCGTALTLPYTRFVRAACHTVAAQIPDATALFSTFARWLSRDVGPKPWLQSAPALGSLGQALFPFSNQTARDVRGGHHDGGPDYGRYSQSEAETIHRLLFAVDNFPGVSSLDNLGVPESGDGLSDVAQEALLEADQLLRVQDADGGFFNRIWPRDCAPYDESLQPPAATTPLVAWPKTVQATEAATAALYELASSPYVKKTFPAKAAAYLAAADKGWAFLQAAWKKYGRQGAYQALGLGMSSEAPFGSLDASAALYSNDLDTVIWCKAARFAATGDAATFKQLEIDLPGTPRDWWSCRGWAWQMYRGCGNAIRDVAFCVQSGRLAAGAVPDAAFLKLCQDAIKSTAQSRVADSNSSAYGVCVLDPTNGPYGLWIAPQIPRVYPFDMAVAYQLAPSQELLTAVVSNLDYENGNNPANVAFIAGQGWQRFHETWDGYAQNDRRVLPPTGVRRSMFPTDYNLVWLGDRQYPTIAAKDRAGGNLSYLLPPRQCVNPSNTAHTTLYDWYCDGGATCSLTFDAASSLATEAFLMSLTPNRTQPYTSLRGTITLSGTPTLNKPVTATFTVPGVDLSTANRIVWEASGPSWAGDIAGGMTPVFGSASQMVAAKMASAMAVPAPSPSPNPGTGNGGTTPGGGATLSYAPTAGGAGWIEVEAQWIDGRRAFAAIEFSVAASSGSSVSYPVSVPAFSFGCSSIGLGSYYRSDLVIDSNTAYNCADATGKGKTLHYVYAGCTAGGSIPADLPTSFDALFPRTPVNKVPVGCHISAINFPAFTANVSSVDCVNSPVPLFPWEIATSMTIVDTRVFVSLTTSKGLLTVQGDMLPETVQKSIYVNFNSNPEMTVMTLYDALRFPGCGFIRGLAPKP